MMKKVTQILIIIIVVSSIIVGAAVVFAAFLNRVREFRGETAADRIITISPNITEIAFAIGLGDKIIAVSTDSDYPPEAKQKAKVGSFWQPDLEKIIAARPNLVITETFEQHKTIADNLKRLNINVLSLRIDTIEEMVEAIVQIGRATGRAEAAEQIAKEIQTRIDSLKIKLSEKDRPKVLWVIQPDPLRAAGEKTFINELIEIAGGKNAIGPTLHPYPQVDEEELLISQCDVIIQSAMNRDIQSEQRAAEEFWSKKPMLAAVKKGRIYTVNSDLVLRLGPRLPEGIETIARLLHPEIFDANFERRAGKPSQ